MSFLIRVDESLINKNSNLIGHEDIYNSCKRVMDIIHGPDNGMVELCDELDIRSINIFHGETGTGKTTLSYSLAKYALEKFEIETYELKFQDIITAELGKTLENFHLAFDEVNELCKNGEGVVLFLDEFDRILVDRKQSNEVSEMKRAFISLMDFFQSISLDRKITILATTNCFYLIDPALKRRFSFHYEVKCNELALNECCARISKKNTAYIRLHHTR
ncbi:ATP-binding protein [Aeromonas sp. FDAARGOS 1407]|uniref:ATP-binding protein n=1 Tax=Aeromonas TaxID=642 RepID=UPI001C23F288|nr:ATP-binding protein [Aeromonas sp. FDAARGOS 1407]QXC35586.1 ATP-binding protein [Aeromonas sp. FDAARGOS 1407]